jgi:hypothetical protein
MKRLVAVFVLMLCLSLPVMAGHIPIGGAYCNCGTAGCVEDYAGECGGYMVMTNQQNESPGDITAELGIAIVALLFWLRLRA